MTNTKPITGASATRIAPSAPAAVASRASARWRESLTRICSTRAAALRNRRLRNPPRGLRGEGYTIIDSYRLSFPAAALLVLTGCGTDGALNDDRPPADVGGRFSIVGFSFGAKPDTYGYEGKASPEEAALRAQAEKFDNTVWQGVVIGAAVGAIAGVAAGHDGESAAAGTIVGASIGALAGIYVANKQKQYASAEDRLNSMIADIDKSNAETAQLIADTQKVLDEDRQRLTQMQARYRQGQATEHQFIQERARVWSNRKVVEKAALGAKDRYRIFEAAAERFEKVNPGTSPQALQASLKPFRARIDQMDKIVANLTKA